MDKTQTLTPEQQKNVKAFDKMQIILREISIELGDDFWSNGTLTPEKAEQVKRKAWELSRGEDPRLLKVVERVFNLGLQKSEYQWLQRHSPLLQFSTYQPSPPKEKGPLEKGKEAFVSAMQDVPERIQAGIPLLSPFQMGKEHPEEFLRGLYAGVPPLGLYPTGKGLIGGYKRNIEELQKLQEPPSWKPEVGKYSLENLPPIQTPEISAITGKPIPSKEEQMVRQDLFNRVFFDLAATLPTPALLGKLPLLKNIKLFKGKPKPLTYEETILEMQRKLPAHEQFYKEWGETITPPKKPPIEKKINLEEEWEKIIEEQAKKGKATEEQVERVWENIIKESKKPEPIPPAVRAGSPQKLSEKDFGTFWRQEVPEIPYSEQLKYSLEHPPPLSKVPEYTQQLSAMDVYQRPPVDLYTALGYPKQPLPSTPIIKPSIRVEKSPFPVGYEKMAPEKQSEIIKKLVEQLPEETRQSLLTLVREAIKSAKSTKTPVNLKKITEDFLLRIGWE